MSDEHKRFNLEERTFNFARDIRAFVRKLPRTISNLEDVKQLIKSSGSVAANYIEANEALSNKDFHLRIKISRKEAKESILWLRLLYIDKNQLENDRSKLIQEASELKLIFSSILNKK